MYRKTLNGQFFLGFFPSAIAYTTQATYGAFILNAANGEIGVYVGTTGTTMSSWTRVTTAWGTGIAAGQSFTIVQKILDGSGGNSLRQTPPIPFENVTDRVRTLYSTPVRQVTYLGYAGTGYAASANLPTFVAGSNNGYGYDMSFNIKEQTSLNQPLSEYGLNWNQTNNLTNWTDTLLAERAYYNKYYSGSTVTPTSIVVAPLAYIDLVVAGAGVATTIASGNIVFTRGSNIAVTTGLSSVVAGNYIRVDTSKTSGSPAANSAIYKVISVSSTAIELDAPFTGNVSTFGNTTGTETVLNANVGFAVQTVATPTDWGFKITALDFGRFFAVAVSTPSEFDGAAITYDIAYKEGFGDPELITLREDEAINYASGQNNQTSMQQPSFGLPSKYVVSTLGYNVINLQATYFQPNLGSPVTRSQNNIRIFTPATSASLAVSPAQTLQNGLSAAAASPHATLTLIFTGAAN